MRGIPDVHSFLVAGSRADQQTVGRACMHEDRGGRRMIRQLEGFHRQGFHAMKGPWMHLGQEQQPSGVHMRPSPHDHMITLSALIVHVFLGAVNPGASQWPKSRGGP